MEKLSKEQSKTGKSIERMLENFYKDPKSRKNMRYYRTRLDNLGKEWTIFTNRHAELQTFEATNSSHPYFEEDFFSQVKSIYEDLKGELEDNLHKLEASQITDGNSLGSLKDSLDDIQRRIRTQLALMASLDRSLHSVEEAIRSPQSRAFYQQHLANLNNYWHTISTTHHEILAEEDTSVYDQAKYIQLEIHYQAIAIKLIELSQANQHSEQRSTPNADNSTQPQHSMVRLPKITIPTFEGNYSKWKQFHDLFLNLIHLQPMADSQKMFYLKSNLTGEPSRLIQHLQVSDENYKTAWDLLRSRYDNKRLIVSAFLNSMLSISNMNGESASALKRLHDTVNEAVLGIKNQGLDTTNWDAIVLHLLLQKIDRETHRLFEQTLDCPREIPSLTSFLKFIESRFQLLETLGDKKEKGQIKEKDVKKHASLFSAKRSTTCTLCKKQHHSLRNCNVFLNLPVAERLKTTRRLHCCINCLKNGHNLSACPSRGCFKCNARHNTLLHYDDQRTNSSSADSQNQTVHAAFKEHDKISGYVFLGTAIINVENSHGEQTTCRAIVDSGSQLNFVSERLIKKLRFSTTSRETEINGIGHLKLQVRGRVNLCIYSRVTGFSVRIEAFVLPEVTSDQPSQALNTTRWPIPKNIQLADPEFYKPMHVDMLLGAEIYCELMSVGQIKLAEDLPSLQNSVFGWIVLGKANRKTRQSSKFCGISTTSLETQLGRFWALEECDSTKTQLTLVEKDCESHFNKHTFRNEDGRFTVKLPFAKSPRTLGNSMEIAIRRFLNLERRLERNAALKEEYSAFMQELLNLNHMEQVTGVPEVNYFLPHHCVLKPDSTTTRLRVVFDGSCKSSTNVSLNDILLVGPTIQSELFDILIRFRLYKYVFTADITKMYRQILVAEDDRRFQMIVWRNSPSEKLQYYHLRTVTYGTASAPYLAIKCLHRLAEEEADKYPLASKVLKRDFYVDDVMTGSDNLDEALALQTELKNVLTQSKFPLRKWCANHPRLLHSIPKEDVETITNIGDNGEGQVKTLGLIWTPRSDKFSIKITLTDTKRITKRSILGDIAQIYDPLGLVNPVVTMGKIFMQELWKLKLEWDESIPQELQTKWLAFRQELKYLKGLQIPRHVLATDRRKNVQIHAFSDASEKAYGTAIYLRSTDVTGHVTIKLLCAKSKVAPSKLVTLPRLELAAAHLMVKLVKRLKESIQMPIDATYLWTDSMIIMSWINSESSTFKVFVANRVSYIQEHTQEDHWKHVPTKHNPADLASRGLTPRRLLSSKVWFEGPDFLLNDPEYWPKIPQQQIEVKDEVRKQKSALITTTRTSGIISHINHKNSFKSLQHIIAYILRFKNLRKSKNLQVSDKALLPTELQEALIVIIREIQNKHFSKELKQLSKQHSLDSTSKIKSLTPFLDNRDVIRVGGRLQAANISLEAKHPMLLPHKDEITKLLMKELHEKHLHAGPQALLAITRQQFWPTHGKILAQTVVHNCVRCSRLKPKFVTQLMGNLPAERVQPARPFFNTGVDFCGPIQIHYKIRGKRPTKAYIAVFICFTTKAIHLELVSDLTKDAFLGALKRFIGRRGRPSKIFCDNATNFVGAKNDLNEVQNLFSQGDFQEKLTQYCADEYIQWCFIPPRAPHFGGLWEAAVKSAKHHLRRVLLSASLTYEELNTVLVEIEAVLNSRPLTPLSSDPNDLQVLSPGHFLIGEPLTSLVEPHVKNPDCTLLKRWELVQTMRAEFWKRWSKEYLQQLQERTKWQQPTEGIRPGTLVLLKDDNIPPLKWSLGRVTKEHKGPDNLSRVVEVKTEKGTLKRAIHKLCPLPIETDHNQKEQRQAGNDNLNDQEKTQRTKQKKGNFLPINNTWLQTPFKPSTALQKYNKHISDSGIEDQPLVKRKKQISTPRTSLLSLLVVLILVPFAPIKALKIDDVVEINSWTHRPLIYFEDVAKMAMVTDRWNIMAYYNLNNYWKEITQFINQLEKLKNICNHLPSTDYCQHILSQFQRQVNVIRTNNEILLRRNGNEARAKRSPLDIVGTITNKLFGILDQNYADEMSKTIDKVNQNENHLLELIKNQTSIIDSTENIIKKDRDFADRQFSRISDYLNELQEAIQNTNQVLSEQELLQTFNTISIHSTLIMVSFQQLQSALIDIVTDCHNGKINPLLLTPGQLRKELFIIRENIPSTLTVPGRSDHEDLLQLYNLMTVQTRVTTEYVLFNIYLPLVNKEIFQIFRLVPIPVRVEEDIHQVKTSTNFIAVSLHRDYYYMMTEEEISRCITNFQDQYVCNKKHTVFHKTTGEAKCELSLMNQNSNLPDTCTLESTKSSPSWIQLHDPNSWIYAFEQETVLNIVCGTQTYQTTIQGLGLLSFKSSCIIKQNSITISSHIQYSSKIHNSLIPSMMLDIKQLKAHLNKQEVKKFPDNLIMRNNTEDISQLKTLIQQLHTNEQVRETTPTDIHQYTISYLALVSILILLGAYLLRNRLICTKSSSNYAKPKPTPRRSNFQLGQNQLNIHDLQQPGVC